MDERNEKIILRSMAITLSIIYLLIFAYALFKYVKSGDINSITLEIIIIIGIPACITVFALKDESLLLPKNINGSFLSVENDEKSKKQRLKLYFLEALGFSTFCILLTVLDSLLIQKDWILIEWINIHNKVLEITINLFIEFIIALIIFYTLNIVINELIIKRYNKKIKKTRG